MTPASSLRLAIVFGLLSASALRAGRYEMAQPCMGTLFTVVIYSDGPDDEVTVAAERAFAIAHQVDASVSDYRADSELGKFHRAPAGGWFAVGETFASLLELSLLLEELTSGSFDIANGALTHLWRRARRLEKLPDPDKLAAARAASGMEKLEFDAEQRRIRRSSKLTRLDFGGIAKGYAADRMLASLRKDGFPRSSIAAAGDIAVGDPPPGKAGWRIELRPLGDSTAPAASIELANAAVSSSGDAEQAMEIEGRRYSHIIDPATGLGMIRRGAASCIAPSAAHSDALATALCLLGEKRGLALVESLPATEALIFDHRKAAGARSSGFKGVK